MPRFRHFGTSSTFASSDTLDDGLEWPDSEEDDTAGDNERGAWR